MDGYAVNKVYSVLYGCLVQNPLEKKNVKYQVFNKTKQYYRVKKIFTTGLDFEVSWFLTLKRCHLNKNLICL